MCGIIGFTGRKPAKDILIDGLERLEYRGYDSAGIALLNDDDTLTIRKKAGRVSELRELWNRTYKMGNTWWSYRCECASAQMWKCCSYPQWYH